MAARHIGRRTAVPLVAATGTLLAPKQSLHAESSAEELQFKRRKPIYDDEVPTRKTAPLPDYPKEPSPIAERETTMTSQLANYICSARIFTYAHVKVAEDRFNDSARRFFDLENNVTSTIANLAPDPRTGEKVMPGLLYVIVAGMAGSIVTRNRNILLRATAPVVFAVGASNYLIPHTTRNVGDLVWSWETRYPVVADNHMRVRRGIAQSIIEARKAAATAREQVDETVRRSRETLEGWVRKGR